MQMPASAIINVGRVGNAVIVKESAKRKGRNNSDDKHERRYGERERRRGARFPSRARARAISHSRTHARTHARTQREHTRLLVAAHPVAVLTSSARYSVCAIEISFIPDARKVGARN
jgi:hypothetical protein